MGFAGSSFAKRYIVTLANFFGGLRGFSCVLILSTYPIMLVYSGLVRLRRERV